MSRRKKNSAGQPARRRKTLAGMALVIVFLAGVAAFIVYQAYNALLGDVCGVTVQQTLPSPDAKAALVTFDVDCGAATASNTQVSVVPAGAEFSREEHPPFFVVAGKQAGAARWTQEGTIEISVPAGQQVYRREPTASGIAVIYK